MWVMGWMTATWVAVYVVVGSGLAAMFCSWVTGLLLSGDGKGEPPTTSGSSKDRAPDF